MQPLKLKKQANAEAKIIGHLGPALIHRCPRSLLGFIQYFEPLYYKAETNPLKNPEYKCIGKFHYIKYLAYLRSCTSIVCSSLMQSHWCVTLFIVIVTSMEENLSRPHFGEKSLNLSLYLIRNLLKTASTRSLRGSFVDFIIHCEC